MPNILCNSACLSCENGFLRKTSLTPAACSLHPLKGVYTPFSRGPFGTCPAFNRSHIGDICVPYGTHSCSRPFFVYLSLTRHIYCSRLGIAKGDALPFPYLEIYACLAAPASARDLCYCKPVCIAETFRICHFVFNISKWGSKCK